MLIDSEVYAIYCYLLTFGKLSMLIGSKVYSIVTYFQKTNSMPIVTTGACTIVTKTCQIG